MNKQRSNESSILTQDARAKDRKVVVFCGPNAPHSTIEAVEAISERYPCWRILVVQGPGRRRRMWAYLKSKFRKVLREPISYPLEIMSKLATKIRRSTPSQRGENTRFSTLCKLQKPNVSYYPSTWIHSQETLDRVRQFRPWLGISLAAPILKPSLFEIPQQGTINIHKSYLPNYRGMPPGFWELHDQESQTGVSIHWVARGLDTGDILEQRPLTIPRYATPDGLLPLLDQMGEEMLLSVLCRLNSGEIPHTPQGDASTPTRSMPPFLLKRNVCRRCERKRNGQPSVLRWLKSLVKTCILAGYVFVFAPIRNLLNRVRGTAHVTILLYHRVDDDYLDDVTVGVEQFQQQIRLLAKSYQVLDMSEFLAKRGESRRRPAVVITFDDGYESNYVAARLLRREGLPATFFISTRIVGSERPFAHDMEKLGKLVPALSWEKVVAISEWGFHVGPHTATHANVGKLDSEEAITEISTAVEDIIARLGRKGAEEWFAYPHGKPDDITLNVRQQLKDLGISYCLSAYGGTNPPDYDPLDIKRQGVDCKFSILALRASVEGWRVKN